MRTSRSPWRTSVIALGWVILLITAGCRNYPEVTTAESQEFIKQVYTACNTQNVERLTRCSERLRELATDQKVSPSEAAAFERIIKLAQAGDWPAAQQHALEFAQRQVR
jgi:hypothetical protein